MEDVTEHYDVIIEGTGGDDPATSVLDVNCKAHELDNLYVVDTSFFPKHRGGASGPHRHGQRHPGRRPSAQPDVVRPRPDRR
jgi:GMC oxidoreductase